MPISTTDNLVRLSKDIELKLFCSFHVPFKACEVSKNKEPETTTVSASLVPRKQGAQNVTLAICHHKDIVVQGVKRSADMKIRPSAVQTHTADKLRKMCWMHPDIPNAGRWTRYFWI